MTVLLQQLRNTLEAQRRSLEELEGALESTMAHADSFTKPVRLAVRNLREAIGSARTVEKSIGDFEKLRGKDGLKLNFAPVDISRVL